jgi:SAM-dependent methyltransferase
MLNTVHQTRRSRARAWRLLESPSAWEASRLALDVVFGLYRTRISTLEQWGILDAAPSVLDVGCGTGQYAEATAGTEQHNCVGRWIIDHDRGDYMRSLAEYHMLFELSPLTVERSEELHLGPINTRAVLASIPRDQPIDTMPFCLQEGTP